MNARAHTKKYSSLLALLLALLLLTACTRSHEQVDVTGHEDFRDGDMVLRCGTGAESRLIIRRSNAAYSHIGILQYDSLSTEWMVIHAVPGENAPGEPEYLKREPLTDFFAPMTAQCGAWMRIDCSDEAARRAAEYCRRKADEHVLFDNDYLLEDTTELYCCELVWRAYLREGIDISDGHRGDVPTVICKEGECIFPSHIENSKNTLFVKQFKTKKS